FSVKQGDFFALLGPNGAGKTTLIGILTSLVNKTSGEVSIFGYDLDRQSSLAKSCIGVVPQEFNFHIFDKVIHIIVNQAGYYGLPRRLAYERAEKYLKQLDLWDKRNQKALTLSGGMKRRMMIARALVHEPRLLVLDEPTAGVDVEIRYSMWKFLREINRRGTTIILTTHYLEEAEDLCRHIAVMDKGHIIENTEMAILLRQLAVETFVFDLEQPLQEAPMLEHFHCRLINTTTLEVDVEKQQSLNELFALLSHQQIRVRSMRNKANRLETLFMRLVGYSHDG
ncbi:MAG TPA: ABC transporter ATP-binding protein, partial [Gammaproteobacteria bacterium]|nr:ABC transporter ATP-binding protein [Gammaproteobacteria bacterium]